MLNAPPTQDATDQGPDDQGTGPNGDDQISVFLSKEALGGKEVKPGDKITLTVKDVDSETGEVEATCDYGMSQKPDAFDQAMPPEEG